MSNLPRDLTDAEITAIAEEVRIALAPIAARHRMKYVVSASVQKKSDPQLGTHFVLASEPDDPMWSVIALAGSARALQPAAEAQKVRMEKEGS